MEPMEYDDDAQRVIKSRRLDKQPIECALSMGITSSCRRHNGQNDPGEDWKGIESVIKWIEMGGRFDP